MTTPIELIAIVVERILNGCQPTLEYLPSL